MFYSIKIVLFIRHLTKEAKRAQCPPGYKIIIKFISSTSLGIGIGLLTISALCNYGASFFLLSEEFIIEWEAISICSVGFNLVLILDFISLCFISLVSLIAGSVIIFRTSYMSSECFFGRFIWLVVLFVISIYILILSPNMVSLILGWDGLGVTSYLLVIFYQRSKSYRAGIITALTNRLGDVGLLISIILILPYGTWNFLIYNDSRVELSLILARLIILSACTKSAQMPFSAWLPAAMAAPTPVSALVHSSTLVTAGVYLLIRINILLVRFEILEILIMLGTFTIFIAGGAAMFEMDIKKIIALSTLSQLGAMVMGLGMGSPTMAYFHLLSHAFF